MKFLFALAFLFAGLCVMAQPAPKKNNPKLKAKQLPEVKVDIPGLPKVTKLNPDIHTRLAVQYLSTQVRIEDREFTRFLSWYNYDSVKLFAYLETQKICSQWWIHQLSVNPDVNLPREVPGGMGFLWAIDLRDYNWNSAAWESVALRETYFVEPLVNNDQAQTLRLLIGAKQVESKVVKGLFPVIGVVRADWFFRDTIESERSPSYYDLLYAKRRFINQDSGSADAEQAKEQAQEEKLPWPGGVWKDGKIYPPSEWPGGVWEGTDYGQSDKWTYLPSQLPKDHKLYKPFPARSFPKKGNFQFVDFPKNLDDWEEFYGIKQTQDFLNGQKINLTRGAVVAGSHDDPVSGSIVALNNRVISIINGPFGVATRTYDVFKTQGDKDYIEQPGEVSVQKINFDAGELLAILPNGGQAGLLINGKGERQEFADGRLTHPKFEDKRYPDVRTMMGCVVCHGKDFGFISPKDQFAEILKDGVDLKVLDREERNRIRAFFLGWQDNAEAWRHSYKKLIFRTTANILDPKDEGWTSAKLVSEYLFFRDTYDDPVNIERAANEIGISLEDFKLLASKSPKARLLQLVQGKSIPRETFEKDVFTEMALLLDAHRDVMTSLVPDTKRKVDKSD